MQTYYFDTEEGYNFQKKKFPDDNSAIEWAEQKVKCLDGEGGNKILYKDGFVTVKEW